MNSLGAIQIQGLKKIFKYSLSVNQRFLNIFSIVFIMVHSAVAASATVVVLLHDGS